MHSDDMDVIGNLATSAAPESTPAAASWEPPGYNAAREILR